MWKIDESTSVLLKLLVWARHGMPEPELQIQAEKKGMAPLLCKQTLYQLEKSGVIFISRGMVSIPVPLLRWHLAAMLYPANASTTYGHPLDLLVAVLEHMDPTILKTTLSRKDKKLCAGV